MSRQPASPPPPLVGRLEVETPEHVRLDYELSGVGSRLSAAILDQLVLMLWAAALAVVASIGSIALGSLVAALWILAWGAGSVAYYTFFEAFRRGQTPGKRMLGIRVVMDTGHPVTFAAALTRNLLRLADFLPPPYLGGVLLILFHPKSRRMGDLVAGTVVVRDRPDVVAQAPFRPPEERTADGLIGPPLSQEEWRLLTAYHERQGDFPVAVRARLEAQLATRFADRFPVRPAHPGDFLEALHRTESARRSGAPSAAGGRTPTAPARRLEAAQETRWTEFERIAARTAREGLDALAAAELPDFAARYREVASDLARLRTYGADERVQARVERLVAAGHNQLYIDDRQTFRRFGQAILRDCPGAVWQARRAVALALIALFGPAVAAYVVIREQPALAQQVLPEEMLERAQAGRIRNAAGLGYFEADAAERPLIASKIISNNVRVSFNCFAGGIFLGVGSLVLLSYNGLSLGATAGHFANEGLFTYLFAFIVGHGVLELFAIAVAGAAGFLLGFALLAPGDLTRGEALVVQGRLAIRMVGAVVVLLMIAGAIEGLASASDVSITYRLAVSSASAVFLLLYLVNGARWASTRDGP